MGLDTIYQNCFIDNKGPGSIFNGPQVAGYAADNYVEENEMETCDGFEVSTSLGSSSEEMGDLAEVGMRGNCMRTSRQDHSPTMTRILR